MNENYQKNSKKSEEDLMKQQIEKDQSTLASMFPMLVQQKPQNFTSKSFFLFPTQSKAQTDPVYNELAKDTLIFLVNFVKLFNFKKKRTELMI
jgi:hypothetical protein